MSRLSTAEDNLEIAQRLVAIRETSGLTQVEFAEKLGLSPRAYQNYERGEREPPVAVFNALYRVFKIDPLWLMAGPGIKPSQADHRSLDIQLMEDIVRLVEHHLINRRAKVTPQKKARLVRLIYEHCMDDRELDEAYLKEMVLLTA